MGETASFFVKMRKNHNFQIVFYRRIDPVDKWDIH